jgi:hypothetical protein
MNFIIALIGALITMGSCFVFVFTLLGNGHTIEAVVCAVLMVFFWFYAAHRHDILLRRVRQLEAKR